MTRMTGPDCVVMCNLINTYIHTYIYTHTYTHTYIHTLRYWLLLMVFGGHFDVVRYVLDGPPINSKVVYEVVLLPDNACCYLSRSAY